MKHNDILIISDVIKIAKFLSWHNEIGKEKALEIIEGIHRGKYGSHQGIWVQVNDAMTTICEESDNDSAKYSWELGWDNLLQYPVAIPEGVVDEGKETT